MMRLRAVFLLLALVLMPFGVDAAPDRVTLATGSLEHFCTMQAIRPDLVLTASHCVSRPGAEHVVHFVRGAAEVPINATVVWDGSFADYDDAGDIALLRLDRAWPHTIPLADTLPAPGARLRSVTYALGIRHWPIETDYVGLHYVSPFGWSLLFRGLVGGGASGAALTVGGQIVGTISAGSDAHRLNIGVPVGAIARALRDYDRRGSMRGDGGRDR